VPLFKAIQKSDTPAVKRLLDRGLDANARDAEDTSALIAAVLLADASCVKLVLDHGADPNATDKSGATALMWAVPDIAKTKLLIVSGADVNASSKNLGRTPLLIAASYPGSVAVLQLLLDHGANLHAIDRRGMHALGRAALSADADWWERYWSQNLLGASLAGQGQYAEAEPLLISGYQGMMQRKAAIPLDDRRVLSEAGERTVQLYENWERPEKASEWRQRLRPE